MTGLVRKATLLSACGLLVASVALAGVPKNCGPGPTDSACPCNVLLAGKEGATGPADPLSEVCVTLRDAAGNPVIAETVTLDFTDCATGVQLATVQGQTGTSILCATSPNLQRKVWRNTDAFGQACFRLIGAGSNSGNSPGPPSTAGCVKIFAGGNLIGNARISMYDQEGLGGVAVADLSLFLTDLFGGSLSSRSDYDCSATVGSPQGVGVSDLSLFLLVQFGGKSITSGTPYCP